MGDYDKRPGKSEYGKRRVKPEYEPGPVDPEYGGEKESDNEYGQAGMPGKTANRWPGRRSTAEESGNLTELGQALVQRKGARGGEPPSIHDVATAAVEAKGSGGPLDSAVQARVEGHLGADLSGVRVHGDPLARQASAAMGARAFTFGKDVFLGPGESGSDVELMAHELTHVVQQGAAGTRAPQQKVEVGGANSPAEKQADAVAGQVAGNQPPTALIVNGAPTAGQIGRAEFMMVLRASVLSTARDALGMFWSVAGCPYIERWFNEHASIDARSLEAMARKYSGVTKPVSARDYIAPICNRLRAGIVKWREGGDVSAELQAAGMSASADAVAANPSPAGGKAQPKLTVAGGGTPEAVAAELGPGQALDANTASRMGGAFGESFADVRIHTDAVAARKAADLDAAAFTVGRDVVFGAGQYQPGTMHGDALLAHELAHVSQQRGAADDPVARKKPVGGESEAHEENADQTAYGVLQRLWNKGTAAAGRAGPALSSDVQLQRCKSDAPQRLAGADFKGAFEGQRVGTQSTEAQMGGATFGTRLPIYAKRTLGAYDNQSAAAAAIKTNGTAGAITIEHGKYIAYETEPFTYKPQAPLDDPRGKKQPPSMAGGVLALVSSEGLTLRGGEFDPTAMSNQDVTGQEALKDTGDPFQGYKDALAGGKGLDTLSDTQMLTAFGPALKDTALNVLARSEVEVREKQKTYAGSGDKKTGVAPEEVEVMKRTATQLSELDKQISEQNTAILAYGPPEIQVPTRPILQPPGHTAKFLAASKEKDRLEEQRRVVLTQYPLLARVTPSEFIKLKDDEMLAKLNGELPGILTDIEETRGNILSGELDVWELPQVVDATIAGLGIADKAKRQFIKDHAAERSKKKTIKQIVITIFAIGFGIAAAVFSGGASLAFAAGALGLGAYDAIQQTNDYLVKKPAGNTGMDPQQSIVPEDQVPGYGWLIVAWVGVGLDLGTVVSTVAKIAKAEISIAKAAEELAEKGAMGLTKEQWIAKLRTAAGDIDPALKITEATKAPIANRLGINIEIDAKLGDEVHVVYQVDKQSGKVTVTGMRAGTAASIADLIAHENVVALMRRYEGLTGKARTLWEKLLSVAGKSPKSVANPFQKGSQAFEAWHEVQKLPELIKIRTDRIAKGTGTLGKAQEQQLRAEVEFLQNELAHNQKIVDQMLEEGEKVFVAGKGYVAKTGERTLEAGQAGLPLPDIMQGGTYKPGKSLTQADVEKSAYYYRKDGDQYQLAKKADKPGPSKRVDVDADGKFKGFSEGELTRAEQGEKIVGRFSPKEQAAFAKLKGDEEKLGNKVVPIEGMHATGKSLKDLAKANPGFRQEAYEIILETLVRGGEKKAAAAKKATEIVDGLMDAKITVIQGTDQLRAYGYRANFLKKSGTAADDVEDLHHLVALYLGGDHKVGNLLNMPADLHRRMHELIEGVKFDKGVTLAPHSIQNADFNFTSGAAILYPDGSVAFRKLQ